MNLISVFHMNFPIVLLLSPAQTCSDLSSYISSNHSLQGTEEHETQSLTQAYPRSPSLVEERSKSPCHTVKKKPALLSSFPLPLLYLVLLRNLVTGKTFSSRLQSLCYGYVDLT